MKYEKDITTARSDIFEALARWAASVDCFAFYVTDLGNFSCAIGAMRTLESERISHGETDTFERLRIFAEAAACPVAGYLGYDLKNELEDLRSENPDVLGMPDAFFFEPEMWIRVKSETVVFESDSEEIIEAAIQALAMPSAEQKKAGSSIRLSPGTSREAYINAVQTLKLHLHRGDIYEANYCMQFAGEAPDFGPLDTFLSLQKLTEAPFSVFAKLGEHYVMSASPERFLKNQGGTLISQPIKGTIKRSSDPETDAMLREKLRHDPKEQSENVMIVDLVRNDLSRVAARGSVRVKELFGMVPFKTVHHMVSTITAQLASTHNWMDAIKACFPMGSMTGAPKISAMKCIEESENFKRGAYSGGFGWIDPSGNFDFNVLIRTLFYNTQSSVLAFGVGSAITEKAYAEKEYDECMLKAQALMQALDTSIAENTHAPTVW